MNITGVDQAWTALSDLNIAIGVVNGSWDDRVSHYVQTEYIDELVQVSETSYKHMQDSANRLQNALSNLLSIEELS